MDPLASVVSLLRPQAVAAKIVQGGGRWGVQYPGLAGPSYSLILQGSVWLKLADAPGMRLEAGDFMLFPTTPIFSLASDSEAPLVPFVPPAPQRVKTVIHGDPALEPNAMLLGGHFEFDPINAALLVDLLPRMLLIRAGDPAIQAVEPIVSLIKREAKQDLPGQELVLSRFIEVLLVEALRSAPGELNRPGLLAGLRDPQLTLALRGIHAEPARGWTLAELARHVGMSRSAFAERFARVVGVTPMDYLLQWRLALAKNLLVREGMSVAEAAFAVGYQSAAGFSAAFSRETGMSPKEFAQGGRV